jgi:Cd2+/Zn2+-exporting ATPase
VLSLPVAEDRRALLAAMTVLATGLAALGHWVLDLPVMTTLALGLAYATGGIPAGWGAARALVQERQIDIDLLMIVAALAAAAVGAPFEGAVLLALFSLSGALESRAMGRARRAVESLMTLRPETALRKQDNTVSEVPVADLRPGDVIILRPGASVPVDAQIVAGAGSFDESTITGESLPRSKSPGAQIFEATVNLDGVIEARVARALSESTVAKMIALVTQAQAARAPAERFSAWFGQRYTIAVLLGAFAALGVFLAMGRDWDDALYRAATLLVAASPCAVVISVPAAILSALSAAARGGVLFKGGAALETLAEVRHFAFDKTGTLTTGRAELTALCPVPDVTEDTVLTLLAGIEAQSEHPVASAIRAAAVARGVLPAQVTDARAVASEGIEGRDATGAIWAGNARMMARQGATVPAGLTHLADSAQTVIWLGRGAQVLGAATVADRMRASTPQALADLRAQGVQRIEMMTGDRAAVAARMGADMGVDAIHADLLPADKVALVADLARGGRVAFVGDGVNDAAALARADVGIAMGVAGSDVALQAADVALMSDDLTRLAEARRLAQRTQAIIRQNLTLALGAMVLLVLAGLFGDLPLPVAVIGHEGGTVLVVLNGLRLLRDPIRKA